MGYKLFRQKHELLPGGGFGAHELRLGEYLNSQTGAFVLVFQSDDSHLVVYGIDDNQFRSSTNCTPGTYCFAESQEYTIPIWGSGTNGSGGNSVVMQDDGNLVMYRGERIPRNAVWSTNTHGNDGAFLKLQDDANCVIYSRDGAPLWASGNQAHMP